MKKPKGFRKPHSSTVILLVLFWVLLFIKEVTLTFFVVKWQTQRRHQHPVLPYIIPVLPNILQTVTQIIAGRTMHVFERLKTSIKESGMHPQY